MSQKKIVIIGAGVAGLSIAWSLACAGYAITIFEKNKVGRGASHAAAGMLAAVIEAEPGEDVLLPFNRAAQMLWPAYAHTLKHESGIDPLYRETGTLFIAAEHDDLALLRQRQAFLAARGLNLEWLERGDLKKREAFLNPRVHTGLFSPDDHQVDNRALVKALHAACLKKGVHILDDTPVDEVMTKNGRVTALRVADQLIPADHVILAGGAWSGQINGVPQDLLPPVFPMKGQMLALQMEPHLPLLRHVMWTRHVYLVPREDGRLIIGATMEDKGFDNQLTAGGMLHLLRETWDVLPGIDELPLLESWVGFRPTSRDDAPILGPSGIEGLTYATGQHRHGILMTPLIADAISAYIQQGVLPAIAAPFTMKRFHERPRNAGISH